MTTTAVSLGDGLWRVTEADAEGRVLWTQRIAMSPAATEAEAIAAMEAAREPPDSAAIAADAAAGRDQNVYAELRRRIAAVADETAQMNLAGIAAAGGLSAPDLATFQAGLGWIAAMRAAADTMAGNTDDYTDDENWPDVPAGVAALAAPLRRQF